MSRPDPRGHRGRRRRVPGRWAGRHAAWARRCASWARRRAGLDRNPARRGTDRIEAWARIGLVVFFLIAAPVATIGVGRWSDAVITSHARARAAAEYQVPATLRTRAPGDYPAPGSDIAGWTPARWTAPDGTPRSGEIVAPAGILAGQTVRIWTDVRGNLVTPPLGQAQITSRAISFAAMAPPLLALVLLGIGGLLHRALDRRRMAAWEAGWAAVEPQWTRRLRG